MNPNDENYIPNFPSVNYEDWDDTNDIWAYSNADNYLEENLTEQDNILSALISINTQSEDDFNPSSIISVDSSFPLDSSELFEPIIELKCDEELIQKDVTDAIQIIDDESSESVLKKLLKSNFEKNNEDIYKAAYDVINSDSCSPVKAGPSKQNDTFAAAINNPNDTFAAASKSTITTDLISEDDTSDCEKAIFSS